MTTLPLSGITVVSLEQAVAAPFATRQLADLGARVVKIERPDVGDFARGYDESVLGQASYFVWLNRSKESLGLDLKAPQGLSILDELLRGADVFVQNLGPNAAARLGLSRDELVARYPQLIVCEISGYGNDGPWADRKAYDLLVQCESGVVSLTGEGDVSAKAGISIADIAAGMHAYSGILAALYRRATSGEVSSVEVSIFEALLEWMGSPLYFTMYSGTQPSRMGLEHATIAPYGPYQTKDGETIVLAVQNEREWCALCEVLLGDASIASDPRFATNSARVEHRAVVRELIDAKVSVLSTTEVTAVLDSAGVAHARVNTVHQAIDHPALLGRDRWRDLDTPGGEIRALIPPAVLSGVEARMDAVPAVGAHTASILAELGRSDADIAELARAGVVSLAVAAVSREAGDGGAMTHHEPWLGRYFEDFVVGDVYEHPLGRTVTATDNSWFTLLTQNTAWLHFDHNYAAQTTFGKPLVNSTFTLALVTGQSVIDVSFNVMANLGWESVTLPHPVFEGDTVYSRSEVIEARESRSHPEAGVVTVLTTGFNQDGVTVISFRRTLLVYRQGEGPTIQRPPLSGQAT